MSSSSEVVLAEWAWDDPESLPVDVSDVVANRWLYLSELSFELHDYTKSGEFCLGGELDGFQMSAERDSLDEMQWWAGAYMAPPGFDNAEFQVGQYLLDPNATAGIIAVANLDPSLAPPGDLFFLADFPVAVGIGSELDVPRFLEVDSTRMRGSYDITELCAPEGCGENAKATWDLRRCEPDQAFAQVQFIQNTSVLGKVEAYFSTGLDTFSLGSADYRVNATAFETVPAGSGDLVVMEDTVEVLREPTSLLSNQAVIFVANPMLSDGSARIDTVENVRLESTTIDLQGYIHNGVEVDKAFDIREIGMQTDQGGLGPDGRNVIQVFADNLNVSDRTGYLNFGARPVLIELTTGNTGEQYDVFRFDFQGFGGEAGAFMLSGGTGDFLLYGVRTDGSLILPSIVTRTEQVVNRPVLDLLGNYPNPFNLSTEIVFDLTEAADVQLIIYDVTGREVIRLVEGVQPRGIHRVVWRAEDVPSGVYFYRLTAGVFSEVWTMVLLR